MKAVLTIAGSDSSGGAGIQADLKTIAAYRLFGESVITALTAQNTLGVRGVHNVDPAFVGEQIDAVFEDIRPAAVKVGMVSSPQIVRAIAEGLRRHGAENIVVDPVMVATSGSALIADAAVDALVVELFPLAAVVTPNIPEAEVLAGMTIATPEDVERAAECIAECIAEHCAAVHASASRNAEPEGGAAGNTGAEVGADAQTQAGATEVRVPAVLVKGGHGVGNADAADDYLRLSDGEGVWLRGARIDNDNTHGTGCTLSSAIACGLAQGLPVDAAVREAKAYVAGALSAGLNLGHGSGPLDHMWLYE